jgi:hypothetical protein
MKQILLMIAVVVLVGGCGKSRPVNNADPIVEKVIHQSLNKPEGELTEADLAKVTTLVLGGNKITDAGLKEIAKLQQLTTLALNDAEGVREYARKASRPIRAK